MRLGKYVMCCSVALIVGLSSGCTSIPLEVNEGSILGAKTFSLMPSIGSTRDLSGEAGEINTAIQGAIEAEMAKNGVKKVGKGSDLTIGYLIVISSSVSTRAIGEYFGQGTETEEIREKAHKKADEF
jgi:hypothetical protein